MKDYYVYILASESKTIYIGVTGNIDKRIFEHKEKKIESFTKKYDCTKLVFVERFSNVNDALSVEKKLKNRKRDWKVDLIEKENPDWKDLYTNMSLGGKSES